jgi:tetratricopeptide (TPR) repeat protein
VFNHSDEILQPHLKLKLLDFIINEIKNEFSTNIKNKAILSYLAVAHHFKGLVYIYLGQKQNASIEFQKEKKILDEIPKALDQCVKILLNAMEYDHAIKQCSSLVDIFPNERLFFLKMRGVIHYVNQNFELANKDFDYLLEMSPNDAEILLHKAYVLCKMKRNDESFQFFVKAMVLLINEEKIKSSDGKQSLLPRPTVVSPTKNEERNTQTDKK